MATYNITLSDGSTIIPIPDGSTTFTAADIPLVGQNTQLYGSPVATAFLHHLENFAHTAQPSVNTLIGQLWYDTTDLALPARGTLNVYNGTTFDPIANTGVGTLESATLRWNDTNKIWQEEERIRVSNDGELLIAFDDTGDFVVTVDHDGTDLNIVGTAGTTDINITGVTAVNMPSLTLATPLTEIQGGTGTDTYTTGDILYSDTGNSLVKLAVGSNGQVLTLAAGVPSWGSAGGTGTVTSSGSPLNNEVAVFSSGTDINSDTEFTWNGSTLNVVGAMTATSFGGITTANLIDRNSPGTLAATTFSGDITAQSDILLGDDDKIILGTGSDVAIDFDSPDLDIRVLTSATDLNIVGFSGAVKSDSPIYADSNGAESFRAIGDANTWSSTDSYMRFYDSDESEYGFQIGTQTSDGTASRVNARLGDLNLYATNTLVFNIDSTQTTITQSGGTAMNWHTVSGTNTTTTAGVFDEGGSTERNVGYNETPEISVTGSVSVGNIHIGKLLRKSVTAAVIINLVTDSDIPTGGSLIVHNDNPNNTLTIATTGTLQWVDGSGTTPLAGTRTLAYNSICTLRKKSSTFWSIWGNGIT